MVKKSLRKGERKRELRNDESGQVLILFSLIVATLIASLAILHAQNLIAGVESSRAFLSFPKDDIRNLKVIARLDFQHLDCDAEEKLIDQIKLLYASKGTYVDFETISSHHYQLVYSNSEVYFTESLYVEDEDIWLPSGGGGGAS
ncbi:MAG: hypothetical protein H0Z28_02220 [Archaeoglobus sp.]|nr:hypothetical protein [Archaeoglobus sp.]